MPPTAFLTRENLEDAFRTLGLKARAADKIVEIAVYGGSALVLTLPGRVATKDVDAVMHHDVVWLRHVVAVLAEERGWPSDWLNDGVKGWLSHRDGDPEAKPLFKTYPSEDEPGLRVFVASPHYLFAMKCLAMRVGGVDETRDRSDIEALARKIGITPPGKQSKSLHNIIRHRAFRPKRIMASKRSFPGCRGAIGSHELDAT